jgi:hypothetical protein
MRYPREFRVTDRPLSSNLKPCSRAPPFTTLPADISDIPAGHKSKTHATVPAGTDIPTKLRLVYSTVSLSMRFCHALGMSISTSSDILPWIQCFISHLMDMTPYAYLALDPSLIWKDPQSGLKFLISVVPDEPPELGTWHSLSGWPVVEWNIWVAWDSTEYLGGLGLGQTSGAPPVRLASAVAPAVRLASAMAPLMRAGNANSHSVHKGTTLACLHLYMVSGTSNLKVKLTRAIQLSVGYQQCCQNLVQDWAQIRG